MTEMEMAARFPFGVHFRRPTGDIVCVVARGNNRLLIEHHGQADPTWVTVESAADWRRLGEL